MVGDGWLNSKGFTDFSGSTVVHSVGGWTAYSSNSIRYTVKEKTFAKLTAVREIKAQKIKDYFEQISNQRLTFSELICYLPLSNRNFGALTLFNGRVGSFYTTN
jgi:hypothetical protein